MNPVKLIIYLLLAAVAVSCSKDEDAVRCAPDTEEYFYVKTEEKAVVPYKGYDTLKLKHSSGTVHTFYAGPMESGYNLYTNTTSPGCADNIFQYKQFYSLDFSSSSYSSIRVGLLIPFYSLSSSIYIKVNKREFVSTASFPTYPNQNYVDSMMIQGKQYYKILKFFIDRKLDDPNMMLYNAEYGILKIIWENGETLERVP